MSVIQTPNAVYTFVATYDPGQSETGVHGVQNGNLWINSTTKANFYCIDNTLGAQIWSPVTTLPAPITPSIIGSTSAGTATYSIQQGYFTRNGHNVFTTISLTWSGHTGTGNMLVGGFPIAFSNVTSLKVIGPCLLENVAVPANTTGIFGVGNLGLTTCGILASVAASPRSAIAISASGQIHLVMNYLS